MVHYLREELGLTGTKVGCDTSQCGACVVMVNGSTVKSCTCLAVQADGAEITTIEGLAAQGDLHAVQQAFWDNHGLQCGFCTAGMIMTVVEMLQRNPQPTAEEVRDGLEGNLCRCTGYHNIVRAALAASRKRREVRAMTTRIFGSGIRRREDPRLITGQATYNRRHKTARTGPRRYSAQPPRPCSNSQRRCKRGPVCSRGVGSIYRLRHRWRVEPNPLCVGGPGLRC